MFRTVLLAILIPAAIAAPSADNEYARAAVLFRDGKTAEAEAVLEPLTKTAPADSRVWNLLGAALDARKQYDRAEACFRKALQLSPKSAGILNNLGNHYLAAGKPEQAAAQFRQVLAIEPAHPNANLQLAMVLVDRKEGKQALIHLDRLPVDAAGNPAVQLLRAKALYLAGRKQEAMGVFAALEKTANGPAAWYSIGMSKVALGEFAGAEEALTRALATDPTNPDILQDLGLAALRAGHATRAQEVFETLLRSKPEDPEALYQLGRAIDEQGRYDDAILVLAHARQRAPERSDILFTLAATAAKAGFFGDAALALDEYVKMRPDDDAARRERGFAYSCAGHKDEALRDLAWYVKKHPDDSRGRFEYGFALSAVDTAQAVANLNEAIHLKPDYAEARFVRGMVYERDANPQAALPDLEYAVAHRPDHIAAIAALGRVYLQLDRPKDAIRVLRSGYSKAPKDPQILMTLGRALTQDGEREEGARVLEEFAKVGPDRMMKRVEPGVLELLNLPAGEFDRRYEANVRATLVTRPNDSEVRSKLARFLLARNRKDEALTEYRRVLADGAPPQVLIDSGRTLIDAGEYGLAKQMLQKAVADPAGHAGRLDLAIALLGGHESAEAIRQLDLVPAAERLGDYYVVRAQVLDTLGQAAEAANSLNIGLEKAPTRSDLYVQATYFLLRHRRDAEALKLLETATARTGKDDPDLLLLNATLLGVQNQTEKALALLQTISARWPEWGRPYLVRSIIQENHSDSQNALKNAEIAIAMGERSAQAYFYLAQSRYHLDPDNPGPAMEAIRKAVELDPSDPWAQALAGRIAWQAQDYESSVRYLREAIRLKKDFVKAHFWLGNTYRALGKEADAQTELDEVVRIHERNPNAETEEFEGSRDKLFRF